jgi:aminodeoxyfutalosine deaminase
MGIKKLSADKIFDGYRLHQDKVLIIDDKGVVQDLIDQQDAGDDMERYDGILTPGFINCHCHVELSHLKDKIPSGTGLIDFLINIVKGRKNFDTDRKKEFIKAAEEEMWSKGIAGVGDICNTMDAMQVKKASKMRWHSFVEIINFYDANMQKQVGWPQQICDEHKKLGLSASIVAHAPYSVSGATMDVINERTAGQIISIHNQEAAAEDEMFKKGSGDFIRMYKEFDNPGSPFPVSGKSSLQTWLPHFTNEQTILSVHNTYINEEDIVFAKEYEKKYGVKIVFCLCPNANLYIERKMPPVDLFIKYDCHVVLGTDSYSSNWELSIGSEVKALMEGYPSLGLERVLRWATSNGAKVLEWEDLGSFEKGKKPRIVLLGQENFSTSRIF